MQKAALLLVSAGAVVVVGGLLFAWSGLYNVAASEGHWPVTRWLLEFGMRSSVETHADEPASPALDDPALAMRGAGHFQGGCAFCHGAPGEAPNAVVRDMLPTPPELAQHVPRWTDGELFWIVKHGLKYTGMPAWPAQGRDDEVWAMVAFLRALPGLDAVEYRRLAIGDVPSAAEDAPLLARGGAPGEALAACARCHGLDGAGRGLGAYPRIAGQTAEYLRRALREFASGARPSGIMQPVAAELSEAEARLLAEHYSSQDPPFPDAPADAEPALLERGRRLAQAGAPERGVPACDACHGDGGVSTNPLFPSLAGQYPGYIAQQLELWRRGVRGETPAARIMAAAVRELDAEQARALALHYGSLRPR